MVEQSIETGGRHFITVLGDGSGVETEDVVERNIVNGIGLCINKG